MKLPLFPVAAALAVSTALTPAFAQESTTLPKVTVTATAEDATPAALSAPSVATSQERLRQIPGSTAVVPQASFEDTRAATIKDMLDYTPGVISQSRINEESRLSIRGSGLSRTFHMRGLYLYQDGIPIHLADGASDFQDIDPLAVSHVEVFKGANALHLGAATLGGAINFVTPTGYTADPLSLRLEGGSFGTMRGHVSSGQVIGDTDYFVSFTKQASDGFREHSRQNNARLHSNLGHRINDRLETRFYFTYVNANQELPGGLTKDQLRSNPRQAQAASVTGNYQRDYELFRVANKTTWLGDGYTLNGGLYTIHKELFHPIFQLIDHKDEEYGAFANVHFDNEIGGNRNELIFGTDARMGNTHASRFVNLGGGAGALTAQSLNKSRNLTFYGEDRYHATDEVMLVGGAQYHYAERDFSDYVGTRSGKRTYHGFSPKIGAIWEVKPQVQLYTNVSGAYEPPTFSELTQFLPGIVELADVDAQKSYTFEIGTRGSQGRWNWDIAAYRSWLRDEIMLFEVAPAVTGTLNADRTIHQGLELGMGVDIVDGWSSRVAYTLNDFRFDGDAQWGDNRIPGVPMHYLRAELRYDHAGGWYVAPNLEAALDNYYVDMANTQVADAYAILGMMAGVDVNERVALFFDARNLTNEKYIATTSVATTATLASALYIPGDGRSFYAGMRYKF